MANSNKHRLFFLRYAPNAFLADDKCAIVGLIVQRPDQLDNPYEIRFAPSWRSIVKSVDPNADFRALTAIFEEMGNKLQSPQFSQDTFSTLEQSLSNAIRLSDERWPVSRHQESLMSADEIASIYLK